MKGIADRRVDDSASGDNIASDQGLVVKFAAVSQSELLGELLTAEHHIHTYGKTGFIAFDSANGNFAVNFLFKFMFFLRVAVGEGK